jgi:proteic killer suppression protein
MHVDYATRELERQCTEERYMQRKLGATIAKALRLRIAELRRATEMQDLLLGTGRWEELKGDRSGQWSARLTANWRLIVRPEKRTVLTVIVIEIVDYHDR